MKRRLTVDEYYSLQRQFDITPGEDDSFSASGEHYILTQMLNKLGHYPRSRGEALRIAEDLLCNHYPTG